MITKTGDKRWFSLLLMRLLEVGCNVVLELGQKQRSSFSTVALMSARVFNLNFVEDRSVVQLDKKGI